MLAARPLRVYLDFGHGQPAARSIVSDRGEMGREIVILWAGRHHRDEWDDLCRRYVERIEPTVPVRQVAVKVRTQARGAERLHLEAEAIRAHLPDPCWLIALDRKGSTRSSLEWSRRLTRVREEWPHAVAFVLGSDLGLDRSILDAARETVSFGPMTLPHELARLVLCEQIYRAFSIAAGIKYHRESL